MLIHRTHSSLLTAYDPHFHHASTRDQFHPRYTQPDVTLFQVQQRSNSNPTTQPVELDVRLKLHDER